MLASRTFTGADQIRFADLSGDRNPMHLDEVKARRTQASVQAVHGVHLLLWALDVLARDEAHSPVLRLRATFKRFVAIHEKVALALAKRTEASARLDFVVAGLTVAQISLDFGSPVRTTEPLFGNAHPAPATPCDLSLEQMEGLSGRLAFASAPGRGRSDVSGRVRLARSTPCRRARRHIPVGRHGVPGAAFHLWRPDR